MKRITVAIDGHSSTGKSTLAKQLAQALDYIYVDSGAMYRCVALFAIKRGFYAPELDKAGLLAHLKEIKISFQNSNSGNRSLLNGEDVEDQIRTMDVSNRVSEVAAIPEVRRYLVAIQQEMGKSKGVVMDGRDIGTVVFPDAELKVFMTASEEVRAQRRVDEMRANGQDVSFDDVLKNISRRDHDDSTRKDSPLVRAEDARELDNSELTRAQQFELVLKWANQIINS